MKKISIIIVTYNSIDLIKECIDSIFLHNDLSIVQLEVIIVDNSDEVTSRQLFHFIKTLYGDQLVLIKNDANLGYGQGNNVGINAAKGDIICIMNPDVRFTEPLLKIVQTSFEKDSNLGLLGFKQIGGKNLSFYLKPESDFGIFKSFIIKVTNRLNFFNKNKFYLSGAFMFLDKNKFIEIGKFDENIFMHFEEPDISNRLLKKGYFIKFENKNKYIHLVGNRKIISDYTIKIQTESLRYYLDKYHIDKKKYCRKIRREFKIKLFAATLFGDKQRVLNFKNEYHKLEEIVSL